MVESFHAFHSGGATEAEGIMGLEFSWGAVDFSGILADAQVERADVDESPSSPQAAIIKARRTQFPAGSLPRVGAILTGSGRRYRVADSVIAHPNDPFISIPVIEIPVPPPAP